MIPPVRIVIIIDGRLVQRVYCTTPNSTVEVIDTDTEGRDPEDVQEIKDALVELEAEVKAGTLVEV